MNKKKISLIKYALKHVCVGNWVVSCWVFLLLDCNSVDSFCLLPLMQIGDCLGALIKTFKSSFLPFFDELSSYLLPMWVSVIVCWWLFAFSFVLLSFWFTFFTAFILLFG